MKLPASWHIGMPAALHAADPCSIQGSEFANEFVKWSPEYTVLLIIIPPKNFAFFTLTVANLNFLVLVFGSLLLATPFVE